MQYLKLSKDILNYIETFGSFNADYEALYDEPHERFGSPDCEELYNAGIELSKGKIPLEGVNSSFMHGGYKGEKKIHDSLLERIKKIQG